MPEHYRGRPAIAPWADLPAGAAICPTAAIQAENGSGRLDLGRCIQCGLCAEEEGIDMAPDYELAQREREALIEPIPGVDSALSTQDSALDAAAVRLRSQIDRLFRRSLHVRHIDAGSCDACESELKQLTSPYYDLHRLGIFITTSPRHADLLLVTGPVTRAMEAPLLRTYEAMPEPKLVVAVGACACSGGIFAEGPLTRGGVADVLPVDTFIPGCPPAPLALIQGLLVAIGRLGPKGAAA
ncbi:MAG: NADH-quinone oxidoreductase subunit NuoB [Chloroflexota bacterium]|nr:NADH-quinone oxidoreductase subunit NuoB [Chloroflexota bacterium]